jgi:hypothetical protein
VSTGAHADAQCYFDNASSTKVRKLVVWCGVPILTIDLEESHKLGWRLPTGVVTYSDTVRYKRSIHMLGGRRFL